MPRVHSVHRHGGAVQFQRLNRRLTVLVAPAATRGVEEHGAHEFLEVGAIRFFDEAEVLLTKHDVKLIAHTQMKINLPCAWTLRRHP